MAAMAMLQVGKTTFYYCETCGEEYADNLDDYDPEDFVTLLSANRVSLKSVPEDIDNSVSNENENSLHDDSDDDDDEDVTSLPDVDASQEVISSSSPMASAEPAMITGEPAVISAVEDVTTPSADDQTASSSPCHDPSSSPMDTSVIRDSQVASSQHNDVLTKDVTTSSGENPATSSVMDPSAINSTPQLASSQDGDVPIKDATSSSERVVIMCDTVQDSSQVVTPPHPTTSCDVSLNNDHYSSVVTVEEVTTTVSSHTVHPTSNVKSSSNPSSSLIRTAPNSTALTPQSTAVSSGSASVASPHVSTVTPLQAVDGGRRSSRNITNTPTPVRNSKPKRAPSKPKDINKVIVNIVVCYVTWPLPVDTTVQKMEG